MQFVFASTNTNKYIELSSLFNKDLIHEKIELSEPQGYLEDISRAKAKQAYDILKLKYKDPICVITDDVSLEIEDLNNFPGVYVKHFMAMGIDKIEKIMSQFRNTATAICSIGANYVDGEVGECNICFTDKVRGKLVFGKDSSNMYAFGFDSIFLPDNCPQTYGQLEPMEKNIIGHRGRAFFKCMRYFDKKGLI